VEATTKSRRTAAAEVSVILVILAMIMKIIIVIVGGGQNGTLAASDFAGVYVLRRTYPQSSPHRASNAREKALQL
jgi:hypothetical protein